MTAPLLTAPHPAIRADGEVPSWLLRLSVAVLVGTVVGFGVVPFLSPATAFPAIGEGGEFPVRFLAIRHLAFAAPLLHGIIRRDRVVLRTMYAVFVVMAVLDTMTLAAYGYPLPYLPGVTGPAAGVVATVVFVVPMAVAIRALRSAR